MSKISADLKMKSISKSSRKTYQCKLIKICLRDTQFIITQKKLSVCESVCKRWTFIHPVFLFTTTIAPSAPLILHHSHFHMNIYSPKLSGKSSFCWILNEHRKNKAFYMVTVPFLTMNRWNDVIWYDKIHVTFQRSICIWFVIWRYLRLKREHRNSLPAC